MSPRRYLFTGCLVTAICLAALLAGIGTGSAVPCTPCNPDWSSIKECFSDHPPACCTCTKYETLYYYYLYYLNGDLPISVGNNRMGNYRDLYEMWKVRASRQAPGEGATWGAIKSLFSAK